MPKAATLLIYNLLLPFGLLFMLPGGLVKMRRRGGKWRDLAQRIGFLSAEKQAVLESLPRGVNRLWLHAVSVGEVGIATKLITRLLKEYPNTGIVLTTTTPTGHALAEDFTTRINASTPGVGVKGPSGVGPTRLVILYSPIDLPFVGSRMLNFIAPGQIVLIEAEVWPNLVALATARGIPVSLVNARLSPRSERRFQKFRSLIQPIFGLLKQVLVQEPGDLARWAGLGVDPARIHHTGSIKFDLEGSAVSETQLATLRGVLQKAGIANDQPILLLASTHPGEEVLLSKVYLNLLNQRPDLALLIVPRHVERAADIVHDLKEQLGVEVQRRSQLSGGSSSDAAPRAFLIDTTGELRAWQCLATVVVIGKSFLAEGGQNPAEAVMAQKPVLFGPHMENFDALVKLLLDHHGALQVPDVAALETELSRLLDSPAERNRLGQAGYNALMVHEGATAKTVARLLA